MGLEVLLLADEGAVLPESTTRDNWSGSSDNVIFVLQDLLGDTGRTRI